MRKKKWRAEGEIGKSFGAVARTTQPSSNRLARKIERFFRQNLSIFSFSSLNRDVNHNGLNSLGISAETFFLFHGCW